MPNASTGAIASRPICFQFIMVAVLLAFPSTNYLVAKSEPVPRLAPLCLNGLGRGFGNSLWRSTWHYLDPPHAELPDHGSAIARQVVLDYDEYCLLDQRKTADLWGAGAYERNRSPRECGRVRTHALFHRARRRSQAIPIP